MRHVTLLVTWTAFLAIAFATSAHSGDKVGGGGDLCQSRIEDVRNDIEVWILASKQSTPGSKKGSAQLDFIGTHTDLREYNKKMQDQIALTRIYGQTSIACTSNQSEVRYAGKDKVCIAFTEYEQPRILCYRGQTQGNEKYVDGFMGASQDEQYFQVHHELAVLAGFEDQAGERTNYPLSRQISKHLEKKLVWSLAISSPAQGDEFTNGRKTAAYAPFLTGNVSYSSDGFANLSKIRVTINGATKKLYKDYIQFFGIDMNIFGHWRGPANYGEMVAYASTIVCNLFGYGDAVKFVDNRGRPSGQFVLDQLYFDNGIFTVAKFHEGNILNESTYFDKITCSLTLHGW